MRLANSAHCADRDYGRGPSSSHQTSLSGAEVTGANYKLVTSLLQSSQNLTALLYAGPQLPSYGSLLLR